MSDGKKVLEELQELLLQTRKICVQGIEQRHEMMDESKVKDLISKTEQFYANKKLRERIKEQRKKERINFVDNHKKMKDLTGK